MQRRPGFPLILVPDYASSVNASHLFQRKKKRNIAPGWIPCSNPLRNGGSMMLFLPCSGGIDSSYALYRLKKDYPHLNILAVQFDNGFISETALDNARKFCDLTKSTYTAPDPGSKRTAGYVFPGGPFTECLPRVCEIPGE